MDNHSAYKLPSLSLFFLSLFVLLSHLLLLFWMGGNREEVKRRSAKKPLVAQTVILRPVSSLTKTPSPTESAPLKSEKVEKREPSASLAPSPKKIEASSSKKKISSAKKNMTPPSTSTPPASSPPPSPVTKEALDKAKSLIKKIDWKATEVETNDAIAFSTLIGTTTQTAGEYAQAERGYIEELVERFQLFLTLPESGETRIRLTIDQSGTLLQFAIVEAESPVNRHYLENKIPQMRFRSLEKFFPKERSHTFLITFS